MTQNPTLDLFVIPGTLLTLASMLLFLAVVIALCTVANRSAAVGELRRSWVPDSAARATLPG